MKLRHLFSAAFLSAGLAAGGAQAATFDITEILSFTDGGFRSSLIHDQTSGRMSGGNVADVDSTVTGGTYDDVTGVISFIGSISKGGLSSTFTAIGNLAASLTRTDGVHGNINFTFTGDLLGGKSLNFLFEDQTYTSGGQPNGLASNGTSDFIALWGDLGNYGQCATQRVAVCDQYGIDLRIAYEPGGGGSGVVPLPASALLLLAGIGSLGATRKLRKKA